MLKTITKTVYMRLDELIKGVVVLKYGAIHVFFKSNIKYLKQRYAGQQFKIYVLIDGGLELIYEVKDVD